MFHYYRESDQRNLASIYGLRYRVFYRELGRELPDTCHESKTISDPLDTHPSTHHYCATLAGSSEIVAAMRTTYAHSPSIESLAGFPYCVDLHPVLRTASVGYTGRFVISPTHRKTRLAAAMVCFAFRDNLSQDFDYNLCYCERNLERFYLGLGFVRFSDGVELPNLGYRIPMILDCRNREHLRSVKSPFEEVWTEYERNQPVRFAVGAVS